jgi:hypothetical protein
MSSYDGSEGIYSLKLDWPQHIITKTVATVAVMYLLSLVLAHPFVLVRIQ